MQIIPAVKKKIALVNTRSHVGCAPRTMTWLVVPALRLIPLVSQFLLSNANGWRSSTSATGARCAPYKAFRESKLTPGSMGEL